MKIVVDACSWINLGNSGVADKVLGLSHEYYIGPAVLDESAPLEVTIEAARASGRIIDITEDKVDLAVYASVRNPKLGDGETECITLAVQYGYLVCTDDGLARQAAITRLGAARVLGSLRLLIECVQAGLLTQQAAFAAYEAMVSYGAFLPRKIPSDFSGAT